MKHDLIFPAKWFLVNDCAENLKQIGTDYSGWCHLRDLNAAWMANAKVESLKPFPMVRHMAVHCDYFWQVINVRRYDGMNDKEMEHLAL